MIDDKEIVLDILSTKCKWLGEDTFAIKDIRFINFFDDYTTSLSNFMEVNEKMPSSPYSSSPPSSPIL